MARIPEYTRQVFLDRSQPGNIEAAASIPLAKARSIEQTAERVGQATDVFLKQKKVERQLKAQEVYNSFEREMITKLNEDRNSRMTNPTGFTKDFDSYINKRQEELEAKYADAIDQQYFRQIMDRDRNSYFAKNTDWENSIRGQNVFVGTEQTLDQMNSNFAMSNPDFNSFKEHSEKLRNYVNEVGANVFSPEDSHKLMTYGVDGAASQFMEYKLANDPESLKRVMRYGTGSKEGLIEFVMNDLEGGGRIVSDGDGKAKYGINTAYNDVDLTSLTEEKAKEIYRTKYWDERLNKFDPAFRAVAFDALVQHGNDKNTWRMIDIADGDPYSLIAMRQNYYKELISKDPEKYGKNEKGWQNRMEKLTGFIKTMEGGGADFIKQTSLINPKIIGSTLDKLDNAIEQKKRVDAARLAEANEASEVEKIVNQQELLDRIESDESTTEEKMLDINKHELSGLINQEFAADARRYLESKEKINAITKNDTMADIVTRMYDLNSMADMNEKDYLRGVQNLRQEIMRKRAAGELSRDDEDKLSNQIKTLMSNKVSDATQTLSLSFGDARKVIDTALPPDLRGVATRKLFYKVDEESQKNPNMTREEQKALYTEHAAAIVDEINQERRAKALKVLDKKTPAEDDETALFLKAKGYSMDDVKETAKKYGLTEKQVIDRIKAK